MQCRWLSPFVLFSAVVILTSCASNHDQALKVRQFHLRDVDPADEEAQMVRGEQNYRLKGAVTLDERRERLGQYYTVSWNSSAGRPTRLVMDFQQAATGSTVKRMSRDLPPKKSAGKVEFRVAGSDYNQGGRVLAWRIRLLAGDQVLREKRSYLWR